MVFVRLTPRLHNAVTVVYQPTNGGGPFRRAALAVGRKSRSGARPILFLFFVFIVLVEIILLSMKKVLVGNGGLTSFQCSFFVCLKMFIKLFSNESLVSCFYFILSHKPRAKERRFIGLTGFITGPGKGYIHLGTLIAMVVRKSHSFRHCSLLRVSSLI